MNTHPDFADIIPISQEDIDTFAQPNVSDLPKINDFKSLFLQKDTSEMQEGESSFDALQVTYYLCLKTSDDKVTIGEFNLFRIDGFVEYDGKKPINCWGRISSMKPASNGISYGRYGFTRAALKTLIEESARAGVDSMCAIISKKNINSLKMAHAVGFETPITDFTKDNIKSNGHSYLFHEKVSTLLEKFNQKTALFKNKGSFSLTPLQLILASQSETLRTMAGERFKKRT